MPTYDYRCKPCDKTYERFFKRFPTKKDENALKCDGCEGPLERMLSAPGIIIRGVHQRLLPILKQRRNQRQRRLLTAAQHGRRTMILVVRALCK